jgi:hypothetical protein
MQYGGGLRRKPSHAPRPQAASTAARACASGVSLTRRARRAEGQAWQTERKAVSKLTVLHTGSPTPTHQYLYVPMWPMVCGRKGSEGPRNRGRVAGNVDEHSHWVYISHGSERFMQGSVQRGEQPRATAVRSSRTRYSRSLVVGNAEVSGELPERRVVRVLATRSG